MLDPTAQAMETARRRNVNATELGMKPMAYDPGLLPERAAVELKADGIGLLDINSHLQTLEGVPFEAALHLAGELAAIRDAFGQPMMLHGEYVEKGGFNATLSAFRSGQGTGAAVLWDAVPLPVWHGTQLSAPLIDRRAQLEAVFKLVRPQMVGIMWHWGVALPTPEHIAAALGVALDNGNEGIVVKDLDSPYVRASTPFWLKAKGHHTIDVPIQGARVEGGRVKSIVVTVDGKPAVVGAGLSEELRWSPQEFPAGRMVEISHIGKTPAGALKGAAFLRFRDDKETTR